MNFDLKARDWDKDPLKVERARVFAGEIIKFGSGTGLVSFQLKDRFRSLTLADTSRGMMEVLTEKIRSEKILNMKPLLIDIFKDKNGLSDYDIIYTLLVLHHIQDINKTFEVFNKLLKPGGYVCIGDLVTEDGSFHHTDPDFDGHKGFDINDLKERLVFNGFKVEYDSIFMEIEKEFNNEIRKYPLFLLIGKKL
jgi:SAM-dependent methyltransferase